MDFIKVLLIIFISINVIINFVWDGSLTFNRFQWIKNTIGERNWVSVKNFFLLNRCERWISTISFCSLTIGGIIMIIGIIQENKGSIKEGVEQVMTQTNSWVYIFAVIYVTVRLIHISANLLGSSMTEKWKLILPSAAAQIFILAVIVYLYAFRVIVGKGTEIKEGISHENQAILFFIILIILFVIFPYIIIRYIPTTNDSNIKYNN
jgi:hypothetical protein